MAELPAQKLRFALTAYDPNPSEVCLAFDSKTCVVESSQGANVTVEDYKTTPEGTPHEIYLKVVPEPIAFVMKFVDGKMMIEFKGSWAAFQVEAQAKALEKGAVVQEARQVINPAETKVLLETQGTTSTTTVIQGQTQEITKVLSAAEAQALIAETQGTVLVQGQNLSSAEAQALFAEAQAKVAAGQDVHLNLSAVDAAALGLIPETQAKVLQNEVVVKEVHEVLSAAETQVVITERETIVKDGVSKTIVQETIINQDLAADAVADQSETKKVEGLDGGPAFSEICFKVHFVEEDVDAHDIRMHWDMKELNAPEGAPYTIVYQADRDDGGREFVVAFPHPTTGELFTLRGFVKGDKVTILNTDKFEEEHIKLYIAFYIKDPELQAKILAEIEADPTYTLYILYKHGVCAESIDLSNFAAHITHQDKDKNPIPSKDKEDDEHVRKAREAQKKAEEKGKKGSGPPEGDKKPWSCGKVKWELPKEEKKFRDVGKLKIPEFGPKEVGPNLKDVGKLKWSGLSKEEEEAAAAKAAEKPGKLKWGGFDQEEPKEAPKEKPKVGKLKIPFGEPAAAAGDKPKPKRSWKKK